MFQRFTAEARTVVVLAQENARMLNHNRILREHLLLGLIQGEGMAAQILEAAGMTVGSVKTEPVGTEPSLGNIPWTLGSKKVLEYSLREALQLGHGYIGTEHILLGLLRAEDEALDGLSSLRESGLTLDSARKEVAARILGTKKPPEPGWIERAMELFLSTPDLNVLCARCQRPLISGNRVLLVHEPSSGSVSGLCEWCAVEESTG